MDRSPVFPPKGAQLSARVRCFVNTCHAAPTFAASTAGRCLLPVQQPAAMHSSGEDSPPYLTDDVEAGAVR